MAGITGYGCEGTLTIGGIVLNGPAWDIPRGLNRMRYTRTLRGGGRRNRRVGGASGRRAKRLRYDQTEHVLELNVVGSVDSAGAAHPDAQSGLAANQATLVAGLLDPTADAGAATLAATLTVPGSTALTANVQCELEFGDATYGTNEAFCKAVLVVTVPAPGYFA